MTMLTITKARANLSELLEKAKRGEDIGIVSGDQIVALRPVTVSSDDYAWREYGATPAELARFEKRMEQKFQRSGSAEKSNAFPAISKRTWLIETAGFKRAVPQSRAGLSPGNTRQNRAGIATSGAGFRAAAPASRIGHPQADGKLF